MPQVRIIAKNFMDMVASLPAMKLDHLNTNPFICQAILRSLPPLAKRYVLQMLYIETAVTAKTLEVWLLSDGSSKHKVAIERLIQKREIIYTLNPKFQSNLQKHLKDCGVLPREPLTSSIQLPTVEELKEYALGQWECFLLHLTNAGHTEKSINFSSSMIKIFQRGLLSQSSFFFFFIYIFLLT